MDCIASLRSELRPGPSSQYLPRERGGLFGTEEAPESDRCDAGVQPARTVERTVRDIPEGAVDEVILVDDCSNDDTVAVARSLGIVVIVHDKNTGYGGNQKTCYREALARGADIVVMVHPDYQYDPRLIPSFVGYIATDVCDVMLGSQKLPNPLLQNGLF